MFTHINAALDSLRRTCNQRQRQRQTAAYHYFLNIANSIHSGSNCWRRVAELTLRYKADKRETAGCRRATVDRRGPPACAPGRKRPDSCLALMAFNASNQSDSSLYCGTGLRKLRVTKAVNDTDCRPDQAQHHRTLFEVNPQRANRQRTAERQHQIVDVVLQRMATLLADPEL